MIPEAGRIETRLREHYGDGEWYETGQVVTQLATYFKLTPEELAERDGFHFRFQHKVHSALANHKKLGLLERGERGSFRYRPNKLAAYVPRHHTPRLAREQPSPQNTASETGKGLPRGDKTVEAAIRRLKLQRRAITLAIRELERGMK
ncbi:MAG: winged helix-turn-helix domain-containing protein [Gemmataceae bacterium]|nr:winged helix-turn-helix domain-containing protein [Gemmataceae bacterium]